MRTCSTCCARPSCSPIRSIPFVTEELWPHVGGEGLLAAHVAGDVVAPRDLDAEGDVERVIATVQAVRSWRDAGGVKPGAFLAARIDGLDELSSRSSLALRA